MHLSVPSPLSTALHASLCSSLTALDKQHLQLVNICLYLPIRSKSLLSKVHGTGYVREILLWLWCLCLNGNV